MVGCGRGRGRGNQAQQTELAQMRHLIEELSRAVQALQRQEPVEARMEIPKGDHDPLDMLEGGLKDNSDDRFDENPFHDAGPVNNAVRGRLEEQLLYSLDLNGGHIKVEVADFHGKMHAKDYLGWEATEENYFEWKPMADQRKVQFVKLK